MTTATNFSANAATNFSANATNFSADGSDNFPTTPLANFSMINVVVLVFVLLIILVVLILIPSNDIDLHPITRASSKINTSAKTVGGWRFPHSVNTMHVVVDEQNLVFGFKQKAKVMENYKKFMQEKYKAQGYNRVVMHIVTKVESAIDVYRHMLGDSCYLYVSHGEKNPQGKHHMRGHDDLLALVVASKLTRARHDVVLSSNDTYRDVARFIEISPFKATMYGKKIKTLKINPAELVDDITLYQKINGDRLRKKTTDKFLASQVLKYGWDSKRT